MTLVELIDVRKTYKTGKIEYEALRGVNFKVEKGEFTALVGPSGSGKTTLLNIIGGLDRASSGQVIIDSEDISGWSLTRLSDMRLEKIGFIFQSYNLVPVLTARENVELTLLLRRWTQSDARKRADELLAAVEISDMANKRPDEMSGGQQQRIAVARAIADRPALVLADEPTANLDSKTGDALLTIMEKLNIDEKVTFLFSTHDQRVVERARRIATLEDGVVVNDETALSGAGK
ncbi:MAG: ABC transporter ATP-binding protein [bacterium]|nr:ABC transporter ATP-binding protein [bacterium]